MKDELSTIVQTRLATSRTPDDAFAFVVVAGPDAGLRYVLDGSQPQRILVGHGPACELRLSDREVSRRHASLELVAGGVRVVDLESKNGTFVQGVRVRDAELAGGETLRVGSTEMRVELAGAARTKQSADVAFGRVVGASLEMRRIYPLCAKIAAANVTVLVEGETGTGKEVLAEAIHEMGPRANGPFVVFDCTAVPPSLIESELFGHEKGAFTGATATRRGVFEQANGGTLLVDEIGDLDPALQPKLLRVLERSEVRRVGGGDPIRVDVRVIAATRRDLDREVAAGRFRDDLFHRIAVARVELPPLRARKGDVSVLARHFAKSLGASEASLPASLLARWDDYAWPGNVRELRNAVARYVALGESSLGSAAPPAGDGDFIDAIVARDMPLIAGRDCVIDEYERRYVEHVLLAHGGHVGKAAEASGIARRHFNRIKSRTQKP